MGIDSIIFVILILLIEYNVFTNFNAYLMKKSLGADIVLEQLEEDVQKEKHRIQNLTQGNFKLIF